MIQGFQVNALLRKSWAYQRKNISMNVCILLAPIVIAVLLGVLQALVNNLLAENGKCGCECIECTITDPAGNSQTSTDSDICNYAQITNDGTEISCKKRDNDNCSIEFSDAENSPFCAIKQPSKWVPLFDLSNGLDYTLSDGTGPRDEEDEGTTTSSSDSSGGDTLDGGSSEEEEFSAVEYEPVSDATTRFAYTGQSAFGEAAMARFPRSPQLGLLASDPEIAAAVQGVSEPSLIATYDLGFLTQLGWDFGTQESLDSLQIEPSLITGRGPFSVVDNCTALQQVLDQIGANSTGTALDRLLRNCATIILRQMPSTTEIDDELYCTFPENTEKVCGEGNQTYYAGAFDWKDTGAGSLNVDIYENDIEILEGNAIDSFKRISKPISRVATVFLEEWLGETYRNRLLSMTDMPKPSNILSLDFSSFIGPLFFVWLVQLPLPWAVVQLVYEKQHRLRSMMRMHGLSNSVYLLIMYSYFAIQYLLYIIVMIIAGVAANLEYFKRNSYGVQIVFYFLYGNCQVAFAFLLSCFFSSTRTANVTCWIWVLGAGLFAGNLLDSVFAAERWWALLVELIPTFGAYRGLWELGQYSFRAAYQDSTGMTFSDINRDGTKMGRVWIIFIIEWAVFLVLAWYLEQVISNATGIRKHWLFPFQSNRKTLTDGDKLNDNVYSHEADLAVLGDDVLRERNRAYEIEPGEENLIVLRDLKKEFPPQDGNPKKTAVHNMSLSIARGECFGLLGPNGAGKSTSINMMIGFLEATQGEAIINGRNIKTDMNEIYTFMGVCPQHDLLWETLTAREHLNFYARLKRLSGATLTKAVDSALKSVNLFDVANKRAGQFSGGMKRRLSCAISLIGEPAVTYLDEPSTGLDPASRRQLWGTIADAKQGKAVVLTTHSMEEAEILCDRLGIFIDGRLACVGPPKALAARYGGYHVFTITTPENQVEAQQKFVLHMSPTGKRTYLVAGTSKWQLPSKDISLANVFETMNAAESYGLTVLDWGVHSASLEDVFIQLAQESQSKGAEVVQMS